MTDDDVKLYLYAHRKARAGLMLRTLVGGVLASLLMIVIGKVVFFDLLMAMGEPVIAYAGAAIQLVMMAGAWVVCLLNYRDHRHG